MYKTCTAVFLRECICELVGSMLCDLYKNYVTWKMYDSLVIIFFLLLFAQQPLRSERAKIELFFFFATNKRKMQFDLVIVYFPKKIIGKFQLARCIVTLYIMFFATNSRLFH